MDDSLKGIEFLITGETLSALLMSRDLANKRIEHTVAAIEKLLEELKEKE